MQGVGQGVPERHGVRETALRAAIAIGCLMLLPAATASAEMHEHEGAYAKAGIGLGFIDPDLDVDVDPGAGISFTGGYHLASWLAAEGDITVVAGAKVENSDITVTAVGFTIGAKAYPLGAMDTNAPEWLDPYGIFGIGGGYADAEDVGDDSSFLVRFAFGAEFMNWENKGLFVQGGYDIVTEDLVDGVGHLIVGGIYRFE